MIPKILTELGLGGVPAVVEIAEHWSEIVGPVLAEHAEPVMIRENMLEVSVESSVWCQELQLQKRNILKRLENRLGEASPGDLWLRVR